MGTAALMCGSGGDRMAVGGGTMLPHDGDSGGYFAIRCLSAGRYTAAGGDTHSCSAWQEDAKRYRELLRVPRYRLFCRCDIYGEAEVVAEDVPSEAPGGSREAERRGGADCARAAAAAVTGGQRNVDR